jgi:hypothetical protein
MKSETSGRKIGTSELIFKNSRRKTDSSGKNSETTERKTEPFKMSSGGSPKKTGTSEMNFESSRKKFENSKIAS